MNLSAFQASLLEKERKFSITLLIIKVSERGL